MQLSLDLIRPSSSPVLLTHFSGHFPCTLYGNSRVMRCLVENPHEFLDRKLSENCIGTEKALLLIDRYLRATYGSEENALRHIDPAWTQTFADFSTYTKSSNKDDYKSQFEIVAPVFELLIRTGEFTFDDLLTG